jgi:hypothetical protein
MKTVAANYASSGICDLLISSLEEMTKGMSSGRTNIFSPNYKYRRVEVQACSSQQQMID